MDQDIHVDAVIVGGGITGITSAYLLANKGLKVAILEADKLLNGTTGHTTAKITAQHDLIYDELITNMGSSKARLYYEANIEALGFIKKTIEQYHIDCDFSTQDAYMYATTEEYAQKIQKEAKAYEKLHIDGELVNTIPLDISVKNALIMRNQAQFHPLKYLKHLVQNITEKGGLIFENTVAVNVETGTKPTGLHGTEAASQPIMSLPVRIFPSMKDLGFILQECMPIVRMFLQRSPKVNFRVESTLVRENQHVH